MTSINLREAAPTDLVLPFTIDALDVRGRAVRLGPLVNEILRAHAYPAPVAFLLAEALALVGLLGSVLASDGGQITLQARSDGPVTLLVADYAVPGALRGYCSFDVEKLASLEPQAPLEHLCGSGYLALTIDQPGVTERYQAIVPLEGRDLSELATRYFQSSEQLPTHCQLGARYDALEKRWTAAGLLIQHLARGEEGRERLFASTEHPQWAQARILASTLSADELTDRSLSLETLLWRLFHETPPRVFETIALTKGCRCSVDRVKSVLRQFSMEQLMDMREPDGSFRLNCAFCSRDWVIERPAEAE